MIRGNNPANLVPREKAKGADDTVSAETGIICF